jgi:hypothetical protein
MAHLVATWDVQWDVVNQFSDVYNEGHVTTTLKYVKQNKFEYVEDYYDSFL